MSHAATAVLGLILAACASAAVAGPAVGEPTLAEVRQLT
jgi:hypothetical protein